jgi:predicted phage terminase large subunit-like protein
VLLQGRAYAGKVYLTNETRKQVQSPEFTEIMARQTKGSRTLWLCSGTEKGTAQHIKQSVKGFTYRIASTDKYVRATPAAQDGWNVGKILVPEPDTAEWVDPFVDEICGFTGVKDLCDDRVDALAALWKLLCSSGIAEASHDLNAGLKKAVQQSRAQQIRSAFRR